MDRRRRNRRRVLFARDVRREIAELARETGPIPQHRQALRLRRSIATIRAWHSGRLRDRRKDYRRVRRLSIADLNRLFESRRPQIEQEIDLMAEYFRTSQARWAEIMRLAALLPKECP